MCILSPLAEIHSSIYRVLKIILNLKGIRVVAKTSKRKIKIRPKKTPNVLLPSLEIRKQINLIPLGRL